MMPEDEKSGISLHVMIRLEHLLWTIVILMVGGGAYWLIMAPERRFQPCDDAIKAKLKAPSTYQRVAGPHTFEIGAGHFLITYEAQNDFGVPIRSTASCSVTDGAASAFIFPEGIYDTH